MDDGDAVPSGWRSLVVSAMAPYGARGSTPESVFAVVRGEEGSEHDRFLVRRILEEADDALLFSAIRRSRMGYLSLSRVADRVGAVSGDNVYVIRDRAARHGDADLRSIGMPPENRADRPRGMT